MQGISVRNLNVASSHRRPRGKTISDDNLPVNFQSPAKLLAQRETRKLKHSSSAADLKSSSKGDTRDPNISRLHGSSGVRPVSALQRRRSTLQPTSTIPEVRQQELQELVASTLADTMVTLHCKNIDEPVYLSEVIEQSLNPTYQFFDLNGLEPLVTRSDEVTVKLWAKTASRDGFEPLVWLEANLQSLQFIGHSLENFYHPLPENCILFHLTDGIYTSFTDMSADFGGLDLLTAGTSKSGTTSVQSTASYDALMRLANLDECIQDALVTKRKLEAQIELILEQHRQLLTAGSEAKWASEGSARTKNAVDATKADIMSREHEINDLSERLRARGRSMSRGRQLQKTAVEDREKASADIKRCKDLLSKTTDGTQGQIRRISEDLLLIFPIEPISGQPLNFTIRGLALPNSTFEDIDKDITAAALGCTAQLVDLLSQYLALPLPYPIHPHASHSSIRDPISAGISQRAFPLYPGSVQYRFEYGVFLLNKDVEFLMNRYGLKMLDIRHTLPNLKYLLYVVTAGTREVPLRKAGGVKALITGRLSPSMSRRASEESVSSSSTAPYARWTAVDHEIDNSVRLPARNGKDKEEDLKGTASDGKVSGLGTFKRTVPFKASTLRETF